HRYHHVRSLCFYASADIPALHSFPTRTLFRSPLALFEPLDAHPGEDPVGLRELDVAVVDDLEMVPPRVEEVVVAEQLRDNDFLEDRKSTRLNSSHRTISYAVFCLKKKKRSEPC